LFSAGIAALVIAFTLEMQAVSAVSDSETIEPEIFLVSLESQNPDSANSFDERFANVVDWRSQSAEREERANNILLFPPNLGGRTAHPPMPLAQSTSRFTQAGIASVYSINSGSRTASGIHLKPEALTAAHPSLPFCTIARVTNQNNGRSVIVIITDRGPFVRGRIIDLTPAAARAIGLAGIAPVTVEVDGASNEADELRASTLALAPPKGAGSIKVSDSKIPPHRRRPHEEIEAARSAWLASAEAIREAHLIGGDTQIAAAAHGRRPPKP
jgi:rare lipoprotein A